MNIFSDHNNTNANAHRSVNETVTIVTHTTIMESASVSLSGSKSCPSIGATTGTMTTSSTSPERVLSPDSTAHSLRERISPIATTIAATSAATTVATTAATSPNSSTCTSPSNCPSTSLEQRDHTNDDDDDEEMPLPLPSPSSPFSPLLSRALAASPDAVTEAYEDTGAGTDAGTEVNANADAKVEQEQLVPDAPVSVTVPSSTSCMNGLVFKPFEQLGASFSRSILGIQVPVSAFEALNDKDNDNDNDSYSEDGKVVEVEKKNTDFITETTRFQTPPRRRRHGIQTQPQPQQQPQMQMQMQQQQTPKHTITPAVEVATATTTKGYIPFLPTPENSPGARSFSSKSLARRNSGTGTGIKGGYKLTPRSASASPANSNSNSNSNFIRTPTQDFGTLLIPPSLPWCRDDPDTNMNMDVDDNGNGNNYDYEEGPIVGEQIVEFGDEFKTCIDNNGAGAGTSANGKVSRRLVFPPQPQHQHQYQHDSDMQSQYSSLQDESSMYHEGEGIGDNDGDNDGYDKINPTGSILSQHSHVDESVEWTRMAREYEEAGDYTSALHYYEQCWDLICFNGNVGSGYGYGYGYDDDSANGSQMMIRNQSKKMAKLLLSIGNIHWKTGNYEKSLKILTMARTNMEEAIADTDRQDRKLRCEIIEELCEILNSIGRLHHSLGNLDESLRYHQKSYVALKSLHDCNRGRESDRDRGRKKNDTTMNEDNKVENDKPQKSDGSGSGSSSDSDDKNVNTNPHPAVARALVLLGTVQTSRCQYDKAMSHFKQGLIMQRQVLGNSHVDLAATMNAIGSLYEKTQELQRAMQCYKKARRIYLEQLGEDHVDYAVSLNNMGQVYHRLGNNKKAMVVYSESLKIMRRVLGRVHRNCSAIMYNMGLVHLDCAHHDQAIKMFRQALKLQRRALGDRHIDVALTLESIGGIYEHKFKMDRALQLYRTALRIRRKVSPNHIFVAITLDRIGTCKMNLNGDIRESIECFDEALRIFELNGMPEDDPLVRVAHRNFISASKLLEQEQNSGGRF